VLCCVKIQNDCSEDNVVLEIIVRRAKLQTNGTIFNGQTQILAYADDIDIIGRSQAAVRDAYLALEREANKEGLKINKSKTKYNHDCGWDRSNDSRRGT
jgi:Reverse transcriptase (RNA-dependent DNA polymerase)